MKRLLVDNSVWLYLFIFLGILGSAGSVLAEEIGPSPVPALLIQEGGVFSKPNGPTYLVSTSQMEAPSLQKDLEPELMSWTTLMSDNFDGSFPGSTWDLFNGHPTDSIFWGTDRYRSVSPNKSVHPGGLGDDAYLPRDSQYKPNMQSWMIFNSPFDFSTNTDARIEFELYLDTEMDADYLYVCASEDGGYFYCYNFSGATDGWDFISLSLARWPGLGNMMGYPHVWIAFIFTSNDSTSESGVFLDNLVVRSTSNLWEPDLHPYNYHPEPNVFHPGDSFSAYINFANVGSLNCLEFDVDEYISTDSTITSGDILINTGTYLDVVSPDDNLVTLTSPQIPPETAPGMYYVGAIYSCVGDDETGNDSVVYPNPIEVTEVGVGGIIFQDNFEAHDLSCWTRFNPGRTGLSVCSAGAMTGSYGACFYRPAGNDKRRQLIDETPVDQTTFHVRFNFDINSLSMLNGERFRFMQVKMGAERPFFIVLKYQSGEYYIQLNTLLDDFTKVKSSWYLLSDAAHVIEVDWQAASAPGANDGYADLYLDDALLESLDGLDNDTLLVENFKLGFTSRLAGKSISGTFYVDDVTTSSGGHIGLP